MNTLVLDNGAYSIKASLVGEECQTTFNGVLRNKTEKNYLHVGNQALKAMETGGYNSRYMQIAHPQVRGLLQDSDMQSHVWRQALAQAMAGSTGKPLPDSKLWDQLKSTHLVMTMQPCLPEQVMQRYAEMVLEDFGFESLSMVTSHSMILLDAHH